MKTAMITGITGQDGAYLAKLLVEKGYRVLGLHRRCANLDFWRLKELGVEKEIEFCEFELLEITNMLRLLEKTRPDEFYNLAAQSFVGTSFEQPIYTAEADGMGVLRILETIRAVKGDIKFYQASTSEMYGKVQDIPQSEATPFYPRSPYGIAKLFGHWSTVNYRESYGMHASSGILFNHESPLRGIEFVTRKITLGLANIINGKQEVLELGNLDAKRDWGFAGDYVEGMYKMLQMATPDDYVLATGETHTVREFINIAAEAIDLVLEWHGQGEGTFAVNQKTGKKIIRINPKFYRPAEVDILLGDPSKAKKQLNWNPKTTFRELVNTMMLADLKRIRDQCL
ncbi:GDP-mannose 4,6-dehydratase [Cysteiniphilum halobium]|uniref:GDP-mannose 4,6-dehydratase n=1 Tax=Cysteiniphilum halobium TaxID=2219059 RepID=UPI000E64E88F|nr:GDP-mannose 4,6-dehydratase [Cysteiniphilum halobium]